MLPGSVIYRKGDGAAGEKWNRSALEEAWEESGGDKRASAPVPQDACDKFIGQGNEHPGRGRYFRPCRLKDNTGVLLYIAKKCKKCV